jgi:sigma-E factor negative regulatory protein RseC
VVLEEGIVVGIKKDKVLVKPERSERCEGCSTAYCVSDESGNLIIEASDPVGAQMGQRIRIAIRERALIGYSFLLYGVPVISLLVGAFGGTLLGMRLGWGQGAEILGVLVGIGLTAASFILVKQYIRKQEPNESYRPVVVDILSGPVG